MLTLQVWTWTIDFMNGQENNTGVESKDKATLWFVDILGTWILSCDYLSLDGLLCNTVTYTVE